MLWHQTFHDDEPQNDDVDDNVDDDDGSPLHEANQEIQIEKRNHWNSEER
jgi:hypothetical protein